MCQPTILGITVVTTRAMATKTFTLVKPSQSPSRSFMQDEMQFCAEGRPLRRQLDPLLGD